MTSNQLKLRYTLLGFFLATFAYGSAFMIFQSLGAQLMGMMPADNCHDGVDNDRDGAVDMFDNGCVMGHAEGDDEAALNGTIFAVPSSTAAIPPASSSPSVTVSSQAPASSAASHVTVDTNQNSSPYLAPIFLPPTSTASVSSHSASSHSVASALSVSSSRASRSAYSAHITHGSSSRR